MHTKEETLERLRAYRDAVKIKHVAEIESLEKVIEDIEINGLMIEGKK